MIAKHPLCFPRRLSRSAALAALLCAPLAAAPAFAESSQQDEAQEAAKAGALGVFEEVPANSDKPMVDLVNPPRISLGNARNIQFCANDRSTYSITWENDIFAGTDSDYTNGVRLSYLTPCNTHFLIDGWARHMLSHFYGTAASWYGVYSLGQNIYTPEDIEDRNPGEGSRPYAGFLYGSVGVVIDRRAGPWRKFDRLDTIALDLGIVGNASNAEHTQKVVHEIINDRKPMGWDDQLEDEIGVRLLFERKWRYMADAPMPFLPFEADVIPHIGLALGNVDTSAAGGVMLRFGDGLRHDYGPPRVRPGLAGPGFLNGDQEIGWNVFVGGEVRAVGRDIFLEGNTVKDSASVDPFPFYSDVQGGMAVQVGRAEMSFTYVLRSPQYEAQSGWAQFGSVNVRSQF